MDESGKKIKNRIELSRSFGIGVSGIPRLIISPAAFDFPHQEKEDVYRIGPLVNIQREGKITLPRYKTLLSRLESVKEKSSGFVVYCSLGTITSGFKKEVKKFFKRISQVAHLNPDCLFILSVGENFNTEDLYPTPDNLFIFDYVPQVDLLQYCDIMITHGGMNSITECIYNNVPMLIYPLSMRWDQPGNSARAVYYGLGLRGKLNKDSAKTISKKLNLLKSNHTFYKNNILAMKEKFDVKNNSDEILGIIERILIK